MSRNLSLPLAGLLVLAALAAAGCVEPKKEGGKPGKDGAKEGKTAQVCVHGPDAKSWKAAPSRPARWCCR